MSDTLINETDLLARLKKANIPLVNPVHTAYIPTASFVFNRMTGGGLPERCITQFWGAESVGKTLLAQNFVGMLTRGEFDPETGEVTRRGRVAWVDAEGAFDPSWAMQCGIDLKYLDLVQPLSGEEALNVVTTLARQTHQVGKQTLPVYRMIVLDSIASLAYRAEIEGEADDAHVALAARKISAWIRPLRQNILRVTGTTVLIINQMRMKIGGSPRADPREMPGGFALKHDTDLTVAFNGIERFPKDDDQEAVAYRLHLKTRKNRTFCSGLACQVIVRVDDHPGIDLAAELAPLALDYGLITNAQGQPRKNGHCYLDGRLLMYSPKPGLPEQPVGSEAALKDLLYQDPALRRTIEARVFAAMQQEVELRRASWSAGESMVLPESVDAEEEA